VAWPFAQSDLDLGESLADHIGGAHRLTRIHPVTGCHPRASDIQADHRRRAHVRNRRPAAADRLRRNQFPDPGHPAGIITGRFTLNAWRHYRVPCDQAGPGRCRPARSQAMRPRVSRGGLLVGGNAALLPAGVLARQWAARPLEPARLGSGQAARLAGAMLPRLPLLRWHTPGHRSPSRSGQAPAAPAAPARPAPGRRPPAGPAWRPPPARASRRSR